MVEITVSRRFAINPNQSILKTPKGEPFNLDEWEKIEEIVEPAKGTRYKGGKSIQEVYRNKQTGEIITRHRIVKSGRVEHDHFRPGGVKLNRREGGKEGRREGDMKLKLTDVQMTVLDHLQDDYEDIEQLWTMIGGEAGCSIGEFKEIMKGLVKDGYVRCYEPTDTELVKVNEPYLDRIDEYWFDLSEKGEAEMELPSHQNFSDFQE